MKKFILFSLVFLFIISCSTKTIPIGNVIDTHIPVPLQCPIPPIIDPPIYPKVIWTSPVYKDSVVCLDDNNMKNLIEVILLYQTYISKLEQILEKYRIQE